MYIKDSELLLERCIGGRHSSWINPIENFGDMPDPRGCCHIGNGPSMSRGGHKDLSGYHLPWAPSGEGWCQRWVQSTPLGATILDAMVTMAYGG